jgi:hypothetical protein
VKTVINDDTGSAVVGDFTLRIGALGVASGETRFLSPGSYVVSEATTTVSVGTTTMTYAQSFSGDCDASGNVVLALGDNKVCTIINDDPGPGGQGGDPGGGDPGGNGDNGNGDGNGNGNGNGSGHGNNRSSSGGRVAGASDPIFMGGADAVPGIPNTGSGDFDGIMGLLIFSAVSSILGMAYLRLSLKNHFLA